MKDANYGCKDKGIMMMESVVSQSVISQSVVRLIQTDDGLTINKC